MNIEEKAKRYDEAIERAKKWCYSPNVDKIPTFGNRVIGEIFPELKESEDEKTKRILQSISNKMSLHLHDIFTEEEFQCFDTWSNAWLEKQGEQNSIEYPLCETVKDKIDYYIVNHFTTDTVVKTDVNSIVKAMKEGVRIGMNEQKPADKIEPKLRIEKGKWYVCTHDLFDNYANKAFCKGSTYYSTEDGTLIPDNSNSLFKIRYCVEDYFHLWTIQDAKDGDVLACGNDIVIFKENSYNPKDKSGCMFVYCSCNNFYEIGGINPTDYKPATKEQRDLLFQKMHEAGYEWDAELKQLKKIEQKPIKEVDNLHNYLYGEQKPSMIQWNGDNLKEVIDFTGFYKEGFEKWFHNSWEEYEKYVHEHGDIFKIFNEDGSHIEVPVGAWIIKAPDGYNTASRYRFIQKSGWSKEDANKDKREGFITGAQYILLRDKPRKQEIIDFNTCRD